MTATSIAITRSAEYKVNSRIGELMLALGKILQENVDSIIRTQEKMGIRFGEAAVFLGLVTESDVQQALAQQFDYPYLPAGDKKFSSHLVAAYQPFSPQVETYRAVRSAIMSNWISHGRKALVILGAESGDGASLFTANLGVVFSQLGLRTLIVDANLRSPCQRQIFDLKEKRGLSDVLVGRADLDVISQVESFANLNVLTAGTLPPNPQELLSRTSFKWLQDPFNAHFDIVLYDVSAYSASSDVLAIAGQVGGVLVVARKNKTQLNHIDTMVQKIASSGADVIGSVLVDF